MIKLKTLLIEGRYDYGCIMAQIDPEQSRKILDFNYHIVSEDMIYQEGNDYGREDDPHITIKYGLTEHYTQAQIQEMIKNIKPFEVMIGRLDVFENEKFDVIKFNVDGKGLRQLREIFDRLPNEDKYPKYNPHMTLAYVKKGLSEKFRKKSIRKVAKVMCDTVIYSDCGSKTQYTLCQ
jgi:hypothetical protein